MNEVVEASGVPGSRHERKLAALCFTDLLQTSLSLICQRFKDVPRGNKVESYFEEFGLKRMPDTKDVWWSQANLNRTN